MRLMRISILLCTHRTNRFFGSRADQLPPTLRKPSEGWDTRHSQGLRLNLGVNCSSGIILSECRQLWKPRRFGGKGGPPALTLKTFGASISYDRNAKLSGFVATL